MSISLEAYVLCESRSAALTLRFLEHFLENRENAHEDFPIPQLADLPLLRLFNEVDILQYLELQPEQNYALYWNSLDINDTRQAMAFFTSDGGLIVGLVCSEELALGSLLEIADVVCGKFGYYTFESPPPATRTEFIEFCRTATFPTLVDGIVHK